MNGFIQPPLPFHDDYVNIADIEGHIFKEKSNVERGTHRRETPRNSTGTPRDKTTHVITAREPLPIGDKCPIPGSLMVYGCKSRRCQQAARCRLYWGEDVTIIDEMPPTGRFKWRVKMEAR